MKTKGPGRKTTTRRQAMQDKTCSSRRAAIKRGGQWLSAVALSSLAVFAARAADNQAIVEAARKGSRYRTVRDHGQFAQVGAGPAPYHGGVPEALRHRREVGVDPADVDGVGAARAPAGHGRPGGPQRHRRLRLQHVRKLVRQEWAGRRSGLGRRFRRDVPQDQGGRGRRRAAVLPQAHAAPMGRAVCHGLQQEPGQGGRGAQGPMGS